MVSNFKLTNEDENWAIFEVDNNGRDVEDVAKEWLKTNEALWRPGSKLRCNLVTYLEFVRTAETSAVRYFL